MVGDAGACALGEGLKINTTLTILQVVSFLFLNSTCCQVCVNEGTMQKEGLCALTPVLQHGNHIGDSGACALAEGLRVNNSLEKLRVVRLFCCEDDAKYQSYFIPIQPFILVVLAMN